MNDAVAVTAPVSRRHPVFTTLALCTIFSTGFIAKGATFDFYWFYAALPLLIVTGLFLWRGAVPVGLLALVAALLAHAALTAAIFGDYILE